VTEKEKEVKPKPKDEKPKNPESKSSKEMLINYSPNISHMKNPACF
jgi:hypothetical protein